MEPKVSQLLDVLLNDTQRLLERRSKPAPPVPVSRADQIIAEGDRKRVAYRALNPDADTAMVYGAQVGYLHGQIQALDAELSTFCAVRDPALCYLTLRLPDVNAAVTVGYTYDPGSPARPTSAHTYVTTGDPGDPGEADEACIREVWLNGVDIAVLLCDETADAIEAEVLKRARAPRYATTACSQCGGEFGPGAAGFSHCADHQRGAA